MKWLGELLETNNYCENTFFALYHWYSAKLLVNNVDDVVKCMWNLKLLPLPPIFAYFVIVVYYPELRIDKTRLYNFSRVKKDRRWLKVKRDDSCHFDSLKWSWIIVIFRIITANHISFCVGGIACCWSKYSILSAELQSGGWVPEKHPGPSTTGSQPLDGDCS